MCSRHCSDKLLFVSCVAGMYSIDLTCLFRALRFCRPPAICTLTPHQTLLWPDYTSRLHMLEILAINAQNRICAIVAHNTCSLKKSVNLQPRLIDDSKAFLYRNSS